MSNFQVTFMFAVIVFLPLRWLNNYILKKYAESPYKYIAYTLLFIGGSLVVFVFLYVMKNHVNI
jgi:hypothetical protein